MMKKLGKKIKHFLAGALAVLLAFQCLPETALAAGMSGGSPYEISTKETLNPTGVSFGISWKEQSGSTYQWDETANTGKTATLVVSYSAKKVRAEGYQPGDLVITLNGIGNANRSRTMEALVGADKAGTATKTRDWTYTWDRVKDTYTLTNNRAIEGGSVFSGYFELVYSFEARETVHGFSQDVDATMYLPYGDGTATVTSNTLTWKDTTAKDTFSLDITAEKFSGTDGLAQYLPEGTSTGDYYFVKYTLTPDIDFFARGLKAPADIRVQLAPDAVFLRASKDVTSPQTADGWLQFSNTGFDPDPFWWKLHDYELEVWAAYPRTAYQTASTTIKAQLCGTFNDESAESLLAQDEMTINVSNFDFFDTPGVIYDIWKSGTGHTNYSVVNDGCFDKDYSYAGHWIGIRGYLNGATMSSGEMASFVLHTLIHGAPRFNGAGATWNLEYVDDWLYIMRDDGSYRKLAQDEYEFTSITMPSTSQLLNDNGIPIQGNTYEYIVYASQGMEYNDRTEVAHGKLGDMKYIPLPAGTNLYTVKINGLAEGIEDMPIQCSVKFHIKDKETKADLKDNLEYGIVANTYFMRLYDDANNLINNSFTADHYTDKSMAADDMRTYGSYLDREKAELHIHSVYSDFDNEVILSSFTNTGKGFNTVARNITSFQAAEGDMLTGIDSVLLFPEGLKLPADVTFPEAIWDHVTVSGLGLSSDELAKHCTITFDENYKGSGRTLVKFHFDFSDAPVSPVSDLVTAVDAWLPVENYSVYGGSYQVYGVSVPSGLTVRPDLHKQDNGSWIASTSLGSDINGNSRTDELISWDSDYETIAYAASSQMALNKWVKTTYSRMYVQDVEKDESGAAAQGQAPYEDLFGQYSYMLKVTNGYSITKDLVLTDILETGPNKEWQGTLVSVDTSYAKSLGFNPVVTYAKTASPPTGDWTTNIAGAKAVKIDFGSGELKEGQELFVVINMKAPADAQLVEKLTENRYSASFTMIDSSTHEETKQDDLTSNLVQVKLSKPRYSLILEKKDPVDNSVLSGASFELLDGEDVVASGTTNYSGRLILRDIPAGEYTLHESAAPLGYETMADKKVVVSAGSTNVMYYTVEDERSKGRVTLTKHNDLDYSIVVPGAVYTLYNAADDSIVKDDLTTGANGQIYVDELEWGSYYFKEKTSPAGYELSEKKIPFTVTRFNVSSDLTVTAVDPQMPASIKLVKYEKLENGTETKTPLTGAFFTLYRDYGTDLGGLKELGTYGTDETGEFNISDLVYGDYVLKELKSPNGYEFVDDIPVTLSPDNREVTVTAYDERMPGTLQVIKTDPEGHVLEGVSFALYPLEESEDTIPAAELATRKPAASGQTDANGTWEETDLAWGRYVLIETKALPGYILDSTQHPVEIGPESLTVRVEVENGRTHGSVTLVKTDESGAHLLADAEYSLYQNDGTLIQDGLVTDTKGEIHVEDLDWGTYYFKEDKAPAGYGLSDELVRFSINADNVATDLQVDAVDKIKTRELTLTKKIKKDDINYSNGTPTFMFTVTGTDINGEEHTWNRMVSFPEGVAKADGEGYLSQTVTFSDIPAGTYTASEEFVSRYNFNSITDVSANGTVKGETVEFDLKTYDDGHATYTNDKGEWQHLSDSGSITNLVKATRKLVGLKVTYDGPATLESGTELTQYLTVEAYYDDGSSQVLTPDQYTLSTPVAPYQSGSYTVTVTYTEDGVIRKGNFTFDIDYRTGMHPKVVDLHLEAVPGNTLEYETGSAISPDGFTVTVTYDTGEKKTLAASEYSLNYTTAPTTDGTYQLKASYTEYGTTYYSNEVEITVVKPAVKHINEWSWDEIQAEVASGRAPVTFSECYTNGCAKEVHLGAGTTSVAYDSNGNTAISDQYIYVNILGFDHDTPADGSGGYTATFGMCAPNVVDGNFVANCEGSVKTTGTKASKAGITGEYVRMESTANNSKGATVMRNYLDSVYQQSLPEDLKAVIVPVKKKASAGNKSSTIKETTENLFLFREVELFGQYGYNADGTQTEAGKNTGTGTKQYGYLRSYAGEGKQYAYYQQLTDPNDLTVLKNALRRSDWWWEASPGAIYSYNFCYVSSSGYASSGDFASNTKGVSFGFCIR